MPPAVGPSDLGKVGEERVKYAPKCHEPLNVGIVPAGFRVRVEACRTCGKPARNESARMVVARYQLAAQSLRLEIILDSRGAAGFFCISSRLSSCAYRNAASISERT